MRVFFFGVVWGGGGVGGMEVKVMIWSGDLGRDVLISCNQVLG